MYKEDLALNNLPWLICHKTQPNQTKLLYGRLYCFFLFETILETACMTLGTSAFVEPNYRNRDGG